MRITTYKTLLDENRKTILVKEKSLNCSEISDLCNPYKIRDMLVSVFHADKLAEEYTWMLAMDAKGHLIGLFEISHGAANNTMLPPREIFVRLCLCGALQFVIVHNHPSGEPQPSSADIAATKRLLDAGELMRIPLSDHIIIGNHTLYSMRENGYITYNGGTNYE